MTRTASRLFPLALIAGGLVVSAAEAGTLRDHRGSTTKVMPPPGGWGQGGTVVNDHRGEPQGRPCYHYRCRAGLSDASGGVLVTPTRKRSWGR